MTIFMKRICGFLWWRKKILKESELLIYFVLFWLLIPIIIHCKVKYRNHILKNFLKLDFVSHQFEFTLSIVLQFWFIRVLGFLGSKSTISNKHLLLKFFNKKVLKKELISSRFTYYFKNHLYTLFFTMYVINIMVIIFCQLKYVFLVIANVCLLWHTAPLSIIHNAQSSALTGVSFSVQKYRDPNRLTI